MSETNKIINCYTFIKKFPQLRLFHLYLVFGNEEYFKKKVIDMIVNRAIPKANRDFDFISLYGDDTTAGDIIDIFSTKPFFSENKVIYIRNFDSLKTSEQQKIITQCQQDVSGNILLLTTSSFDSRLKISKTVLKSGVVVQCRSPYKPEDMKPWLIEEAKSEGKIISTEATTLFVNKVELDYSAAANELEKLLLYCYQKNKIDLSDVQVCIGNTKTHNIFDFINSVGDKDLTKSLIIMENLLDNKEAAVFIVTMLTRLFTQLWKINRFRKNGYSDYAVMSNQMNDIHKMFRQNYLRYAKNYSLSIIPKIFNLLLETDSEIKSTGLDEALILERMLFRLHSMTSSPKGYY